MNPGGPGLRGARNCTNHVHRHGCRHAGHCHKKDANPGGPGLRGDRNCTNHVHRHGCRHAGHCHKKDA
ncbi:hypothetical protein HMPREF0004_4131, partial [Achromobacter piechaudii ATCC 43553]